MAYLWIVVLVLGAAGYLAYTKGVGKEWMDGLLDKVLRRDSQTQVEKLESKASELEGKATQAEKLLAVRKRITAAETRLRNARSRR